MPILLFLRYRGGLITWTLRSLTAAKVKPLTFSMSGFALSYAVNMLQLSFLDGFRYIASIRTAQTTQLRTVLQLLCAYLLLRIRVYRSLTINGRVFWFYYFDLSAGMSQYVLFIPFRYFQHYDLCKLRRIYFCFSIVNNQLKSWKYTENSNPFILLKIYLAFLVTIRNKRHENSDDVVWFIQLIKLVSDTYRSFFACPRLSVILLKSVWVHIKRELMEPSVGKCIILT
jgi:hypothetical protein